MDPTATPPPGAQRSRTHYLGRMERSLSSDTRRYRVQSSSRLHTPLNEYERRCVEAQDKRKPPCSSPSAAFARSSLCACTASASMDSYPPEFTYHHLPLLFVSGLGTAAPPPTAAAPSPATPGSPSSSDEPADAAAPVPAAAETDPFAPLVDSLRKTLAPKKGFSIWDNSRGVNNEFHVVLVEKGVRFPPLKARPVSASQQAPAPLHSPISPLSPSSPLYPDGIMAPIWIRKHREMVPAVFVMVLRISEYVLPPHETPLDSVEKEGFERREDEGLVQEIIERKPSTSERGIKLAVILLCSRQLLDDPTLDARLSFIRRQSGLASRSSLFVISPVPQSEVVNFVSSLKGELYPAAMDYYREHGRRVRRKRARQVPKGKLSDKGWNVRYDYKLGAFSEMRGEMEVALKHYEDSYDTLVEMFASSALLAPRTKRWAEAKVLADCLTVKVCKMYLYLNEPSRSVAQLNRHMSRFHELSDTWGLGEQTFEYWSWLSKQYRLFAELVVIAIRAGFRLPTLRPPPPPRSIPVGMAQPPPTALVPSQVLQHPGYYFYLAGTCSVERRNRYRAILETEGQDPTASPAIVHEMKVDHAELIIDLFTKSYEYFKGHRTSRMTLFVASHIALAHFEGGNYEMALKFHERITRTYRREKWRSISDSIVQLACVSAIKLEEHESAIRLLFELLAPDSQITVEQREEYAVTLLDILRTKAPASPETGLCTLDVVDVAPILDCRIAFWQPSSDVGQPVAFQVSLASASTSRTSSLVFSRLEIQFSDERSPVTISHVDDPSDALPGPSHHRLGNLGDGSVVNDPGSAPLVWKEGAVKVFSGTVLSAAEAELTVTSVKLTLQEGDWTIELLLRPDVMPALSTPALWHVTSSNKPSTLELSQSDSSSCSFRPRSLRTEVTFEHESPAYIDEEYSIFVTVKNEDLVDVEVFLDVQLQPGNEYSRTLLTVNEETSSSLIKAVPLGVLQPGTSLRHELKLLCEGSPSDRSLDISIRSQPTLLDSPSTPSSTEILTTLTIPAIPAVYAKFDTTFHKRRRAVQPLLDLREPDGWEGASDVTLSACVHTVGPWELEVVDLKLVTESSTGLRVVSSSLDGQAAPLQLFWRPKDRFNMIFRLDVKAALSDNDAMIGGAFIEVTWRRRNSTQSTSSTRLVLPSLRPLPLHPSISVKVPPYMMLNHPTTIIYRFSNPTSRLLSLATQVDSSDHFVFAGPRKFPLLVLAPSEERSIPLSVIPLVTGSCALPRMRVFEQSKEAPRGRGEDGEELPPLDPIELHVVEEMDAEEIKDAETARMEGDLKAARGRDDAALTGSSVSLDKLPATLSLLLPSPRQSMATPDDSADSQMQQLLSSFLVQTAFLCLLRGAFFLVCRHYVNISLFSDLRSVIREDGFNSALESPDLDSIALDDVEKGYFPLSQNASSSRPHTPNGKGRASLNVGGARAGGSSAVSPGPGVTRRESSSGAGGNESGGRVSPPSSPGSQARSYQLVKQQNHLYPKLSTSLFCLSFSESSMLFTLVLFGDAVGERARLWNWEASLMTLLSLIIFIIPLGLCLLLSHRQRSTPAPRTIFLTLIPFGLYLFIFYRVGSIIAARVVVEGSHSVGMISDLLARICVPGVFLIASLSGGGAVNTAWEAFEWRSASSCEAVTEAHIVSAERSLYRARLDIQQRTRSLALATSSAAREAEATASMSYFSRLTTRAPAAAHLASSQVEVKALESLEGQMVRDLGAMKKMKEVSEMGRTVKGRIWLAAGWALSVYCVWRVFVSCINLVFGYSQRHHHAPIVVGPGEVSEVVVDPGTDLITSLLGRLAHILNIDFDIATWSRMIGLVLIGSIIVANMRNVLGSVSRIFKATSTGISASFMLLFLAQLMSIYLITSLISLPQSTNESAMSLIDTLPSFDVFSRLFDVVFLVSAGTVFVLRWIERKLRVDDGLD